MPKNLIFRLGLEKKCLKDIGVENVGEKVKKEKIIMCDCYVERCAIKTCPNTFDIHIGDFCIRREELEIYCEEHLPKENAIVFIFEKDTKGLIINYKAGEKFAIRFIGKEMPKGYGLGRIGGICPNAGNYKQQVLPNTKGIVDDREIGDYREEQWQRLIKKQKEKRK